jgi:hypothetical protein
MRELTLAFNTKCARCVFGFFSRAGEFLGAVPGSLKNHLNSDELCRIVAAALTAGCGLFGVLQAVAAHVGTIFPAPSDAAFAALVLTTILEAYRRLGHGENPTPPSSRSRTAGA